MPKKYTLLIDSPEFKKGIEVSQQGDGTYIHILPEGTLYRFTTHSIEDRPTVWQEIVEEPKKKIVERWRGEDGQYYYTTTAITRNTEQQRLIDDISYKSGHYFHTKASANRANVRTGIMCRLMGLAETIEEGSTEMKGKWKITYSLYSSSLIVVEYGYSHPVHANYNLATFSTEKLAQLFLDSAGQDAIDWYGAVK